MSELRLDTVPSTWIDSDIKMPEPYARVVHVEIPGTMGIYASPIHDKDPQSTYDKSQAQQQHVAFTPVLANRLMSFFSDYICYGARAMEPANCHIFANWMLGNYELNSHIDPASIIEDGLSVERNLALGEWAVFADRTAGINAPVHSAIGMGEDMSVCLQVMATAGHVGLVEISHVRELYNGQYGSEAGYAMYVPQTTN